MSQPSKLLLALILPLVATTAMIGPAAAASLSAADVARLRQETAIRRKALLHLEQGRPFKPAAIQRNWKDRGDFTRHYNQSILLFASRALHTGAQLPEANRALRDLCQYHLDRPQTLLEIHSFPWTLSVLPQLCRLYGPDGTEAAGRITRETSDLLLRTLWTWARTRSRLADAEWEKSHTWYIIDSENHHANHFTSCWSVALVLAHDPAYRDQRYEDGGTARAHLAAWTAYLRAYLGERGRKGMTVEIDSPSYAITTLSAAYNIHGLAEDAVLRQRAANYITLFWALWAEQQLDGVGGGAKTRAYPDSSRRGTDFLRRAAWYTLGLGDPGFEHASMLPLVFSKLELPDVIFDLAHDSVGRGSYEVRQRRMGLAEPGYSEPHNYRLRAEPGALVRYGYVTPDFIMGSLLMAPRPAEDWTAISSQNRWMGVIFRGETDARIYPAGISRTGDSVYNAFWAAQARGALVAQKLRTSRSADAWRVYFSKAGLTTPQRDGRWLFTEAPGAYAAVHVAAGDFAFLPEATDRFGRWLQCQDERSSIIIEVAPRSQFASQAEFQRAILTRPIALDANLFTYTSLQGDRLALPLDQRQAPLVNGQTVDLAPARGYDSPFVQSNWDSGAVTIQKGTRTLSLDFGRPGAPRR